MVVGNHTLPTDAAYSTACDGLLYCIGLWANDVTTGAFWTFMLLGFMITLFMATSHLGTKRSFGFAGFTGLVGSIFLGTLGFMSWEFVSAFALTGIISLIVMIMSDN